MRVTVDLQNTVDSLATQVARGVALEDHRHRMLAHSAQHGDLDSLRIESILHRQTDDDVQRWYAEFAIDEQEGVIRIPARPELGMLPRLGVPIRYHDSLLGFFWLIDAEESLRDEDIDLVVSTAVLVAPSLYRERQLERVGARAVYDLLSNNRETRELAAEELVGLELIEADAPVQVIVVDPCRRQAPPDGEGLSPALVAALQAGRHYATMRRTLLTERDGRAVVLLAADEMSTRESDTIGRCLLERAELAADAGKQPLVGVGGLTESLSAAHESYRQALLACRGWALLDRDARLVRWEDLGAYQVLLRLPQETLGNGHIDPGIMRLAGEEDRTLLRTLEVYLDDAGSASRTAAALSIHRTTLYYRLERIETITGRELANGRDRLALHLGLSLLRTIEQDGGAEAAAAPHGSAVPPGE